MQIQDYLRRAVKIAPDKIATRYAGRERSFADFAKRVEQCAGVLRDLGVSDGERVAVLALNSDRYQEVFYAVPLAGGVLVPLNTRLAPAELIYMLNDAGAIILLVDDALAGHLQAFSGKLETVKQIVFIGEESPPEHTLSYETLLSTAPEFAPSMRGDDDLFGIFYTGGTTGLPKGVMLTHNNYIATTSESLIMRRGRWGNQLTATPFFHVSGSIFCFFTVASVDTHTILPKFDPATYLAQVEAVSANATFLVPSMVNMLVNRDDRENHDLSSMELMMYGGSTMPLSVMERAQSLFPNCKFVNTYGMTETAGGVTFMYPEYDVTQPELRHRAGSVGLPSHTADIQIVDLHGNPVERGALGEIVIRSNNVMKGYWNKPEQTEDVLRDGWLHSGDVGYRDADGFVFVVDRLKDMVITGGENVYSAEVENAIYQHPDVAMCAVFGLPDAQWGERVHAVIIPKTGATITVEHIIAHCRGLIAGYKCPKSVDIRRTPLPMSGAGKVLKHVLRQEYVE